MAPAPPARALSVLVCSLGESPGLDTALRAVHEQARAADAETVLVLNTSPDRVSAERLAALERLCGRVLFEPRPGKSHALNTGIQACLGAVVASTDDDALPQPGWLRTLTAPLLDEGRPAELVGCGGRVVPILPPDGVPDWYLTLFSTRPNHFLGPSHDLGPRAVEYSLVSRERRAAPLGANCAYRRDVLQRYGFDPDLGPNRVTGLRGGEDFGLGLSLLRDGYRLLYCPAAVVHHPVDRERLTQAYVRQAYFMQGVESIRLSRLLGRPLPSLARCRFRLLRSMLSCRVAFAASETRQVQRLCKQAHRRGVLAEMRRRGPSVGEPGDASRP